MKLNGGWALLVSRLTDLIAQARAKDAALGTELEREFRALSSRRAFGLNFERHKPETVELPGRPIRKGDKVRVLPSRGSTAKGDQRLWKVRSFDGQGEHRRASLELLGGDEPEQQSALVANLIVIAEFKDYIYPGLVSTGKLERGGDKPFHTVINGENFHVLEALTFTHRGKIDVIYIDPPYNSGARDWKYNNDYVEKEDLYRHSKWLAMMERRLLVARELLNPDKSALIVTIDEKEYLRLGLLLQQSFPDANIQMVTSVINPFGVSRQDELSRVEEYVFYLRIGTQSLGRPNNVRNLLAREEEDDELDDSEQGHDETHWFSFMRAGSNSTRDHSPGCHYPIFVTSEGHFHSVGEALEKDQSRDEIVSPVGTEALWPIKTNKTDGVWQAGPAHARFLFKNGYAKIGKFRKQIGRRSVTYLREGTINRLNTGDLIMSDNGEIETIQKAANSGRTVWAFASHNATSHGTKLLSKMIPSRKFPYPKSLYAVEDALRVCIEENKNAIVLDFFAGSGTTAHAIMRLNRQDGGKRQCISVTNNEVGADEQATLAASGKRAGDTDWEEWGICDYITKPRIRSAITGQTPDRKAIEGNYRFTDEFPIADGFEENAEFFTLTYETPVAVSHNRAFARIAPLLWMRAGSEGRRIDRLADSGWEIADTYGLLTELDAAGPFADAVAKAEKVRMAYIVTDDERRFQAVVRQLPESVEPVRLYESYLTNFRFAMGR